MRVALLPLDSRPPNRLFPQRLAELAGITLHSPPREQLGSLHRGADGVALAHWLRDTIAGNGPPCDAAVFSWDALIYGGLIQSRQLGEATHLEDAARALKAIDWQRTAGYAFITVPRLGISVLDAESQATHHAVREYFIAWARRESDPQAAQRARELEAQLGASSIAALWQWRGRNQRLAVRALALSFELGLRHVHVAVEDNAPSGPHLAEVEGLRQLYLKSRREYPAASCSFFDGADEACCLLTARAMLDTRALGPLPVQLTVHPTAPGADQYTGLFESRSLGDGLTFLARLLELDYHYRPLDRHWLVVHGVQPQPDAYGIDPAPVFDNPYLLPRRLHGGGQLFISDLCACNGANPRLAAQLARMAPAGISALTGFNTNFNTLGLSAAWLRLAPAEPNAAQRRFLLERLADDIAYQSLARPRVLKYLHAQGLDPADFSDAHSTQLAECMRLVQKSWQEWYESHGAPVLAAAGIMPEQAAAVSFDFPWHRAFEIEAVAPPAPGRASIGDLFEP